MKAELILLPTITIRGNNLTVKATEALLTSEDAKLKPRPLER